MLLNTVKTVGIVGMAVSLQACAPQSTYMNTVDVTNNAAYMGDDTCGASELQWLVGQPRTLANTIAYSGPVRIIPEGTGVTMDHDPNRLNIRIDAADMIAEVYCG